MPQTTRTFRVFLSSTFEDLIQERSALQREVFPTLAKQCDSHGARFQAIDLRWGVREEAALDQRTMDICLREIERCQRSGIKPNFIVLLGERYGWLPLPSRIEGREFNKVLSCIKEPENQALLRHWYRQDLNAVPPQHVLSARTNEYTDATLWRNLEDRLHRLLSEAARTAGLASTDLIKYEASATHQEILAGLGQASADRGHACVFFRRSEISGDDRLPQLKRLLRDRIPAQNTTEFEKGDTSTLCREASIRLGELITKELQHFDDQLVHESEIQIHDGFGQERARIFKGRTAVLDNISEYIHSEDSRPLILHGEPGSGKSAVMARASEDCKSFRTVIRRFIGASAASVNGHSLLTGIVQQIAGGETPADFQQLEQMFADRLKRAVNKPPLVVFIDALDQFGEGDPALRMTWLPRELPAHVKLIVSTTGTRDSIPFGRHTQLESMTENEAQQALTEWLQESGRTLQPSQRSKVIAHFLRCGLPLYLKLAAEESKQWPSYASEHECALGEDVTGIVDTLLDRLSSNTNHGELLVSRSLGYLATSRYGLTEDEILEILTNDDPLWSAFDRQKRHELNERRLPAAVWARLYLDLEPYLTERMSPGGVVISFYHRVIAQFVTTRFLAGEEKRLRHEALAQHYSDVPFWLDADKTLPNARKATELLYQLQGAQRWTDAVRLLMDYRFISAKCASGLASDLDIDYSSILQKAPASSLLRRDVLGLIANTLKLSFHAVTRDPSQLGSQLVGRLMTFEEEPSIRALLMQVSEETQRPWLRPLWATLSTPRSGLVRTLKGHTGPVEDVFMSPDGRWAVSASYDRTLKVWDLETGREVRTLTGHTDRVLGVAVSSDWKCVVSTSADKTLKVWDLETGRELHTLTGHSYYVYAVAVSSDGRRAVSASHDTTLKVWDLETGRELLTLTGHAKAVHDVALTPDGRAVSSSEDGTFKVWDLETGRELRSFSTYDLSTYGIKELGQYGIYKLALTADGQHVVSGGSDNEVTLWELETGRKLRAVKGGIVSVYGSGGRISCLAVSGNGRIAVFASADKTLAVWDVETGSKLRTFSGADWSSGVAVSTDGRRAISADDKTLKVWDLEGEDRGRVRHHHSYDVTGIAATGDGRRAVSVSMDASIRLWDLETGERRAHAAFEEQCRFSDVCMSRDGRWVFSDYTSVKRGSLAVWDLEAEGPLETISPYKVLYGHSEGVQGVAITPDGALGISASTDKTVKVWDLKSLRELRTLTGHTDLVRSVALTRDGRLAVSAADDKTLKVWNVESGRELFTLTGHSRSVLGVAITPDGRQALSCSQDGTLKLWDLVTGSETHTLSGHSDGILRVAISPDGRHAISASSDATLRLWDLEAAVNLATFTCDAALACCTFASADRILAGDTAGRIHFLKVENLPGVIDR
jgi:WD40 repeat protein